MNIKERNEKIEQYGNGFNLLTAALAEVPKEAWEVRPEPNEWSVHEIVVHVADRESMSTLRVRKLIVEPGSTLMGYEEAKWADTLNYNKQSADDALQIIKLARQTAYRLLKTFPMKSLHIRSRIPNFQTYILKVAQYLCTPHSRSY